MIGSRRAGLAIAALLLLIPLSFSPGGASASPPQQADIDPANFVTVVDNPYFPLKPGTTYIYEGTYQGHTNRAVLAITTGTRMILGVQCVVITDIVTEDGKPIEQTVDWYAQDKTGNVWYFGEDTEEYENGTTNTNGTWLAGRNGARAGIIMEANPQVGDAYHQEQAPGAAEDMARVAAVNQSITVQLGSFTNVLVTEESTPLEPGYVERKYYAPGIGNVRSFDVAGGHEKLQLIKIVRSPADVGMPSTGAASQDNSWALIVSLGGALSVALGLALRRDMRRRDLRYRRNDNR